jgi:hypothetical protein
VGTVIALVTALRQGDHETPLHILCDLDCAGVMRLALLTAQVLVVTADTLDDVTDLDNLAHLAMYAATADLT